MNRWLIALICVGVSGCATTIVVPADGRWHAVSAIQATDVEGKELTERIRIQTTTAPYESGCTEIHKVDLMARVIEIQPFRDYSNLPEKPPNDPGGTPIKFRDSGPLDMSLVGSRRVLTIGTGYELLVKAIQRCAAVQVLPIN